MQPELTHKPAGDKLKNTQNPLQLSDKKKTPNPFSMTAGFTSLKSFTKVIFFVLF